jgi:glutaredoxin 3
MKRIEIYTQLFCPFCARAVSLLKKKGVAFEEIPAESGSEARAEAARRSGGRTSVPQIFIDGESIGGCDDLLALERTGRLDALLNPA